MALSFTQVWTNVGQSFIFMKTFNFGSKKIEQ
jgi:hypothetical protein